jgi:anti-anti-sigma factor
MAKLDPGALRVRAFGGTRIVGLVGEHDLSSVQVLSDAIDQQFREALYVVVDLTRATFVDSTVVCALAIGADHARSTAGRRFALVAPPGSFVSRVFNFADLRAMMPTYEQLDEALRDGGEAAADIVRAE